MSGRYRAIWKDGKLLAEYEGDKLTYLAADYASPQRSDTLSAPMIMRDIGEYQSPIDGKMITSRSAHREHLKTHDVIEVGNERMGPTPPNLDANPREIGEIVKRHVDAVKAMPQAEYDAKVRTMQDAGD